MNTMANGNIIARIDGVNEELYKAGACFHATYDRIWKSGGEKDAIILRGDNELISPVAYPNPGLWQMSDQDIAEILLDTYKSAQNMDIGSIEDYTSKQYIQSAVLPRMIHGNDISSLAEHGITFIPFLDMAVIFSVPIPQDNASDRTAAFRVTDGLLQSLDVDKTTLLTWANANLKAQDIVFMPLFQMMEEMCGDSMNGFPDNGIWILSNSDRFLGASMILRDDVLDKIGTCFHGDAIILPSSVHEVLAIPYHDDVDLLELVDMVKTINAECVTPEERLSDNVYIYHKHDGYLTAVL